MNEEWRRVVAYPSYDVSNLGRVRRVAGGCGAVVGKLLRVKPHKDSGYLITKLTEGSRTSTRKVHVLVAEAFLPPRPSLQHEVNHIDFDRRNPRASNLEWLTRKENLAHSRRAGRMPDPPHMRGEASPQAKLTWAKVTALRAAVRAEVLARRGKRGAVAAVGRVHGVHRQTLAEIVKGSTWGKAT
jgi:hypothetical protein